ncbi:MAG: hypothetical protein V4858_05750 [Pseudomonadota bacterium]
MKNAFTTTALILVAGLSASASFAGDNARLNNVATSSFFAKSAPSVLSRDFVQSEYAAAVKAGNAPAQGEMSNVRESSVTSTLPRAAVKADFLQAQKAGTLPPMGDRG